MSFEEAQVENQRATNHIATEACRLVATFDADPAVDREAAVGPRQDILHSCSVDTPLLKEHPEHFGSEEPARPGRSTFFESK